MVTVLTEMLEMIKEVNFKIGEEEDWYWLWESEEEEDNEENDSEKLT